MSGHRRPGIVPYLLLVVATASWGGNWVALRAVYEDVTPFALVFWRMSIAALILLPLVAKHVRRDLPAALKHWRWMVFLGLSGPAAFPILGYLGVHYTTAINAAFLNSSVPLVTVPIAWLIRRHNVEGRQLAGLVLSMIGVAVVLSAGELGRFTGFSFNPGDLLILIAVVLWALYTVMLYRRPVMHPFSFFFYTTLVAIAVCIPFYAAELAAGSTFPVNLRTAASVGYLALFPSAIAFLCWNHAVSIVGPNIATFFYPVVPVCASIAAIVLLGEQLHPYHFAGYALVLVGLLLAPARRGAGAAPAAKP